MDVRLKVKGHLKLDWSILTPSLAMSRVNMFTKLIDSLIRHLLLYFGVIDCKKRCHLLLLSHAKNIATCHDA